jgi:hypothetical protein
MVSRNGPAGTSAKVKCPSLSDTASRCSVWPSRSSLTRAEKTKFPFWSTTVPLMVPNDSAGFWPAASCAAGTGIVGASGKGVPMCSICCAWVRKGRQQNRTQSVCRRGPRGARSGNRRHWNPLRGALKPKNALCTIYLQDRGSRVIPEKLFVGMS